MSFINRALKEINCKILYCGTGLSGKTTNVQYIYDHTTSPSKGKLVALSSENERTLFFDFLPLDIGSIGDYKTHFNVYTIPGQTLYEISQQFLLKGVDGIVFVVDSQPERMEANLENFELLERNLTKQGYDLHQIPLVFQYNKRDLPGAVLVRELEATFNPGGRTYFEAIACKGEGVMETLQAISKMVVQQLRGGKIQ